MNINLVDFYRICRNAVRFFPATSPVKKWFQLQTWRVLQRDPRMMHEVGTDTLGAVPTDKNTPFFWSRLWEGRKFDPGALAYEYPLLTAFEMINETPSSIFNGQGPRTYTIELSVLDVFKPEACKSPNPGAGDGRPINQIFIDTGILLDSVLRFIGGTVLATWPGQATPAIANKEMLEAQYPGQYEITMHVGTVWQSRNPKVSSLRVEYPAKNIYGTKARFTFVDTECPTIIFNQTVADPALIGFEAGCTNC